MRLFVFWMLLNQRSIASDPFQKSGRVGDSNILRSLMFAPGQFQASKNTRATSTGVDVLRVIHAARDLAGIFGSEDP
jgi:hypothetical protein